MNNFTPQGNFQKIQLFNNLYEFQEYYLIKEKNILKFMIGKRKTDIIIKCEKYEIEFSIDDLSFLTKTIFSNIDEAYVYIINLFENKKVEIKDIFNYKAIKLLLEIYIQNIKKNIKIVLIYNQQNKDLIINEINNNYNELKNEVNHLKNEISLLKNEIQNLKSIHFNQNSRQNNNQLNLNFNNINNNNINKNF